MVLPDAPHRHEQVTAADCLACALLRYLCSWCARTGGTEALTLCMPGNDPAYSYHCDPCEDASRWQSAVISCVVYCTAVIDAATDPSGYNDQDIYLRALPTASDVDHVAYGSYVARVKYAPLAVKAARRSGGPQLVHPQWPVWCRMPTATRYLTRSS